ncbi:hypothetical protein ACQ4PT_027637 [Festuca glaucescens]
METESARDTRVRSVDDSEIMNKDNDRRSRLRLPQVSGVVRQTSTSAQAAAAPNACAARNSIVDPSRNAAPKPAPARRFKLGRNRASPARLFKLNKILVQAQKDLIEEWGWGGMLKVVAKEMPVDLSMWVLSCFDPIRSELAIPGRGSIPVTADSYTWIFGIRNEGMPVCYEMETEPIKFMNEEYGIESGSAPDFGDWCKMISDMGGVADMKFLRAYFAGFAIDQIIAEVKKMGVKKKSVCCCLHHLVILYLDSLVVDEPVATDEKCPIRAAAWNDKLIQIVMHKDSKGNGEFEKLRKKRKIAVIVGELCTDISNRLGTFVESFGNLMDEGHEGRRKRQRKDAVVHDEDDDDDEGDDDYNGEHESEEDSDGEDDDDDDNREDEDDADGRNDNHSTGGTGEDEQDEDPGCNLQPPPRRSAKLTPQKSHDGPSSNLRKRPSNNEYDNNMEDEVDDNREDEDDLDVRNDNDSIGVPPSKVLQASNPILSDPAKASTTIADGTTNFPKQNKHVTAVADTRAQANADVPVAAKLKMPTVRPPKPNHHQPASSSETGHQQIPQVVPHCVVPPMPPSKVLQASNPILPDPTKASTTIADGTTSFPKQNKHVTARADTRAQANVDVPVAAKLKMPTARPPKANQLQPASSSGIEHQQIPQVMPHCGVPPRKLIQAQQKRVPLPQGVSANREATCPTRESCPPPEPKMKIVDEVTRKRAMLARALDAPSFHLGFDSPIFFGRDPSHSVGITPVDLDAERFGSEEDEWDETTWKEACAAVDKVEREKGYRQEQSTTDNNSVLPGSGFKTLVGMVNNIVSNAEAEGSTTAAEMPEEKRRRLIRQAICQLSPYITYEDNIMFTCSAEVKELYNAVIAHGRRSTRGKEIDKSPILVNYERFFISLKELANSMMPCGLVSNTVMELGIESIMLRKERNLKKIVMPLRVTVMLPVLEDLAPGANEPVNHYWLFVINIRDRRFELLDSIRSLSDRKLAQNVQDMLSSVHALWDQYYANSPIKLSRFEGPEDIKPPKQGTK